MKSKMRCSKVMEPAEDNRCSGIHNSRLNKEFCLKNYNENKSGIRKLSSNYLKQQNIE